jgi:homocysteine S-methyltransferase
MAKYRELLPQLSGRLFLSDGGMETTFIFHDGVELPYFASFVLLETEQGRSHLTKYFERYLEISRSNVLGFVLDTPTWRANSDWGAKLGYDANALRRINLVSVEFLEAMRDKWETPQTPCVISGIIGPRGDGYKSAKISPAEAEDYHSVQIGTFAETAADMISAMTLNTVEEAIGIARASKARTMPCAISFTVETDGKLASGATLQEAVETVDQETNAYPVYFMINCAHPAHFASALEAKGPWLDRIHGIRANASMKSHKELDESSALDAGDPLDLGRRYRRIRDRLPQITILGGCCGTDERHMAAICEACAPSPQGC